MKALGYVEKYRQLSEHYYDLKIDASRQLTRLYIKLVEHYGNNAPIQYVIKAYEASKQSKINTRLGHVIVLCCF